MERYSTTESIQAFARFPCEVGYPKKLVTDEGSQLIKGWMSIKLDIRDFKSRQSDNVKIDLGKCPIGGDNMHGKDERKI